MKDTLIPKKLNKPIKKSIQKTTTATSIIKRKFKTIAKVNSRANPSSTIPESDFRDDDDNDLNPSSSLSSFFEKWPILSPDFYQIDALDLAQLLLGKYLRRDDVVLQITEVEAYRPNDSACHGRFGITTRTAPVFGPGGHAYVYLCYGLHTMLNIVADREGAGAAVLIRSCSPISGLKTIQQRRGIVTEKPVLLTGPGKVGQALGISTDWSNHSLYTPGGLELLDGPRPEHILVGPRVGIDYALPEHVNALWREYLEDGNRIVMPPSALERLVYMDNIEYPMVFEIKKPTTTAAAASTNTTTTTRGRRDDNEGCSQHVSHCGVLEFSADEGFVYVPEWIMKNLQIHPGSILVLKYVALPKGTFMKIRPHRMNFIKLPDPKEILETALKDFACVTAGDTIMITHQYNRYYIDILETNPSNAISLFETDCEVDFAPPLDYKEPEKKPTSSVVRAPMDADPQKVQEKQTSAQDDDQQPKFRPFMVAARRLDGQHASIVPLAASSPPPSSQLPVKEANNTMASEAQPLSIKRAGKLVFGPGEVGNPPSKSRRISEGLDNKKNVTSVEENKFIPFTGKK